MTMQQTIAIAGLTLAAYLYMRKQPDLTHPIITQTEKLIEINGKQLNVLHIHKTKTLILYLHGMAGQLRQFEPQFLDSEHSILAMDYVGHGRSKMSQNPSDYRTDSIVEDMCQLLKLYHADYDDIFLICHSYGCTIGVLVAKLLPDAIKQKIRGIMLLAPKAHLSDNDLKLKDTVSSLSSWQFDIFRFFDKIGGINSKSIKRAMADSSPEIAKRKQLAFNSTTPSNVVKWSFLNASFAVKEDYEIDFPIMLVGGEFDKVCPIDPDLLIVQKWTGSQMSVVPSGHILTLEAAEQINQIIRGFVKRLKN